MEWSLTHRWIGVRVCWHFGHVPISGTCTGYSPSRKRLWRVVYDDGDEEAYTSANMREGMTLYRTLQGRKELERLRGRSLAGRSMGGAACRETRRATSNLQQRPPRQPPDPAQEHVFFPVLVSPACLTATPDETSPDSSSAWLGSSACVQPSSEEHGVAQKCLQVHKEYELRRWQRNLLAAGCQGPAYTDQQDDAATVVGTHSRKRSKRSDDQDILVETCGNDNIVKPRNAGSASRSRRKQYRIRPTFCVISSPGMTRRARLA